MINNNILVSIIIPCFNRSNLLDWHLKTLYGTMFFNSNGSKKQPISHEILVINDGVADDTEDICNKWKDKFNIKYFFIGNRNKDLDNLIWRIPGFSINYAAKRSSGKMLILTNPEIYHPQDTIGDVVKTLIKTRKALVGPKRVLDDRFGDFINFLNKWNGSEKDFNDEYRKLYSVEPHPFMPNPYVPYFLGMWKDDFMNINGYDEDFIGIGDDDNDLVDRLKLSGCKYHFVDKEIVHMFHGTKRNSDEILNDPKFIYNRTLWKDRSGIIKRNINKNWGNG